MQGRSARCVVLLAIKDVASVQLSQLPAHRCHSEAHPRFRRILCIKRKVIRQQSLSNERIEDESRQMQPATGKACNLRPRVHRLNF